MNSGSDDDDLKDLVSPGLPCDDKLTFDTRRLAEGAATVAEYQHGAHLRAYVCRYCELWHLSSQ